MAPFDRLHLSPCSSSIVTMAISCTVTETSSGCGPVSKIGVTLKSGSDRVQSDNVPN